MRKQKAKYSIKKPVVAVNCGLNNWNQASDPSCKTQLSSQQNTKVISPFTDPYDLLYDAIIIADVMEFNEIFVENTNI